MTFQSRHVMPHIFTATVTMLRNDRPSVLHVFFILSSLVTGNFCGAYLIASGLRLILPPSVEDVALLTMLISLYAIIQSAISFVTFNVVL